LDSLKDSANRFLNSIDNRNISHYKHTQREVNTILQWLRNVALEQILNDLGFTQMPPDNLWPRVWWVASDLLNTLPIHASGYHDDPPGKNVMDRVISSYASTIKSLAYSLHRAHKLGDSADLKALLIGMPKTPNLPNGDLPFVEKELQLVGEELRKLPVIEATMIKNPNKEQVLRGLSTHQAIHFACHGSSLVDPSQSMLLVDDWESLPLTVADIIENGAWTICLFVGLQHVKRERS
jgi:hypothetical protein